MRNRDTKSDTQTKTNREIQRPGKTHRETDGDGGIGIEVDRTGGRRDRVGKTVSGGSSVGICRYFSIVVLFSGSSDGDSGTTGCVHTPLK